MHRASAEHPARYTCAKKDWAQRCVRALGRWVCRFFYLFIFFHDGAAARGDALPFALPACWCLFPGSRVSGGISDSSLAASLSHAQAVPLLLFKLKSPMSPLCSIFCSSPSHLVLIYSFAFVLFCHWQRGGVTVSEPDQITHFWHMVLSVLQQLTCWALLPFAVFACLMIQLLRASPVHVLFSSH